MLLITDTTWEMRCESVAQKQELFDYAAAKGVPCGEFDRNDRFTAVGFGDALPELFSFDGDYLQPLDSPQVTPAEFRAMCDAYATGRGPAAPAAEETVKR